MCVVGGEGRSRPRFARFWSSFVFLQVRDNKSQGTREKGEEEHFLFLATLSLKLLGLLASIVRSVDLGFAAVAAADRSLVACWRAKEEDPDPLRAPATVARGCRRQSAPPRVRRGLAFRRWRPPKRAKKWWRCRRCCRKKSGALGGARWRGRAAGARTPPPREGTALLSSTRRTAALRR